MIIEPKIVTLHSYRITAEGSLKTTSNTGQWCKHIEDDVHDRIHDVPSIDDLMETLEMLVDFCVIVPPKSGSRLEQILPEFRSLQEMYIWRHRKIMAALQ